MGKRWTPKLDKSYSEVYCETNVHENSINCDFN